MNTLEKKLEKLALKKQELDQEIKLLNDKRNQHIIKALEKFPSNAIDTYTIIGGLLEVFKTANDNKKKKEEWHTSGAKFCRKK